VETPVQFVPAHGAWKSASAPDATLALIGFSAVIGQIVLTRELIVVFNGNEMSLGILLAVWLFWTAAGSLLSSSLGLGKSHARHAAAALECLLAVSLPPTLWALRASRSMLATVPGELIGPLPMFLASLACLSLFCVVSGALFVVAARMVEQECTVSARLAAGRAYLIEAAGSGLGGILASIVLLRFLDPFQIAGILFLLNLSMAAALRFRMSRKQLGAMALAALLVAIPLLVAIAPRLDGAAQARLWKGFRLAASRDSIYGNLAVTATGSIRSIYDNGVILANAPDEAAAEEAVHYALLEHPAPRHILMIGGGLNGGIAQALEHPTVERIDYVELDPALIGMARRFFPVQTVSLADPRVHTHMVDGRYYLRTTPDRFDVILLNLPDPQTAQLNRFYTVEFFRSARDHLAPGGLLALELRSSEETIPAGLADFLRCIQHTLAEVFPYVTAIPGETIHFFAATQPGVLTRDPRLLMARLRARNLHTQYVSASFIPYRMMPDRMEQVDEQLRPRASTPVNRDFAPIAYYFDVALWSAQFNARSAGWFQTAAHIHFPAVLAAVSIVLLLAALFVILARARHLRARPAAAFCAGATGFTLIALEIVLLLAFQSIYGYVYHQLAVLIGLFMAGIALGSWLGIRRAGCGDRPSCGVLAVSQLLLALSVPALTFAVSLLAGITGAAAMWLAAQCVFPALAALSGMLGGYQFPIAADIYLHDPGGRSKLGVLYAIDLLGGCAGALLLATYFIPVFGFRRTAILCAAVNLAPTLLAARVSQNQKRFWA
jgi:spermidine synthase